MFRKWNKTKNLEFLHPNLGKKNRDGQRAFLLVTAPLRREKGPAVFLKFPSSISLSKKADSFIGRDRVFSFLLKISLQACSRRPRGKPCSSRDRQCRGGRLFVPGRSNNIVHTRIYLRAYRTARNGPGFWLWNSWAHCSAKRRKTKVPMVTAAVIYELAGSRQSGLAAEVCGRGHG